MINDKSTFPPVIYSARALLHSPHCLSCMLSFFFFSQCTRPFTAIVTTTPPGEKTKIQQRGARKKEEIIGNSTLGHASMALFMRFAVFTFFSAIFRVLFSGFSLSSFLFWFFGTRSPWIFAIMETNVGFLNLSIGLPKVAKAGKQIFMGLGRTGVCFYSFATAYADLILKDESTESVLSSLHSLQCSRSSCSSLRSGDAPELSIYFVFFIA